MAHGYMYRNAVSQQATRTLRAVATRIGNCMALITLCYLHYGFPFAYVYIFWLYTEFWDDICRFLFIFSV